MGTILKDLYDAPSTTEIGITQESVICASGGTEQFGNGESYGVSDFD